MLMPWLIVRRRPFVVLLHLLLVISANYVAFLLRFDGNIPPREFALWMNTILLLMAIRGVVFVPFRLYEGLWRYTSVWDVRNIIAAVGLSSVVFYFLVAEVGGNLNYPRSVYIVDALILIATMTGMRMVKRFFREGARVRARKRVLVYGAGDAGEMIVRDMRNNSFYEYEPVGFIDDDRTKVGLRIHGVAVLGTREELAAILRKTRPHEILIAMPRADAATIRAILSALEPFRIDIKTLPNLSDVLDGRVSVSHIRTLQTEDLLNRAPVGLDATRVHDLICGRRVMVTGAGGSIGSELCRQIASFRPAVLVLYERYENSLFAIDNDLKDKALGRGVEAEIGDVTDRSRLDQVLSRFKPEIIFHAAAHKHVPLMELSPCEAVKNNVQGTRILAEMAERHGVDKFVFISTDKAVNPTSVMGATKRIAELVIHAQAQGSGTSFFTVRFGNVLGSNGSVVPRFLDQIKAGGPVTVTHPEIRRFFMLIPEAVQLVLHAAAGGVAGATYVLEMGDQVKVLDMARNLIRLSGFVPDEEIPIEFIGLRPGEKLFEELVGEEEVVVPSEIDKVIQVRSRRLPTVESLRAEVLRLESAAWEGDRTGVVRQLAAMIPEYSPNGKLAHSQARLAYVATELESEPEVDVPAPSGAVCPACQAPRLHRSHTRSVAERLKKSLVNERLYRCHDCGWRGWLTPVMEAPEPAAVAPSSPDLGALDTDLDLQPLGSTVAFSPRNLH